MARSLSSSIRAFCAIDTTAPFFFLVDETFFAFFGLTERSGGACTISFNLRGAEVFAVSNSFSSRSLSGSGVGEGDVRACLVGFCFFLPASLTVVAPLSSFVLLVSSLWGGEKKMNKIIIRVINWKPTFSGGYLAHSRWRLVWAFSYRARFLQLLFSSCLSNLPVS
jgi:hypothetical protein